MKRFVALTYLPLVLVIAIGVGLAAPANIASAMDKGSSTGEPLGPCDKCIKDCKGEPIWITHCKTRSCQARGGAGLNKSPQ